MVRTIHKGVSLLLTIFTLGTDRYISFQLLSNAVSLVPNRMSLIFLYLVRHFSLLRLLHFICVVLSIINPKKAGLQCRVWKLAHTTMKSKLIPSSAFHCFCLQCRITFRSKEKQACYHVHVGVCPHKYFSHRSDFVETFHWSLSRRHPSNSFSSLVWL
jgi:hypothetical protein